MTSTLPTEDILKAARAMSKEERLKLIAEIAALPNEGETEESVAITVRRETDDVDPEVIVLTRQFMNQYSDLLRRLGDLNQ